jgi:Tol biopolymer transport system component
MNMKIYGLIFAVLCCMSFVAYAELSDNFPLIGNERHTVIDEVSGKEVIFLTSVEYLNYSQYPHNKAFLEDDKYLIFESIRPRPDGSPSTGDGSDYRNTERQLFAANIETGDIYWLAALEVEDVSEYGKYHLPMSTQYHNDYAPKTNSVVYYDMTGHNLYMLSLNTGEKKHILNVDEGTIGDPPTISDCGTRVAMYIAYPGPDSGATFAGRTTAIVYVDIDPKTNERIGDMQVVHTWAHQRYPLPSNPNNAVNLTHAVINPANKEEISFCHGYGGVSDGSVKTARIWYAKADGSEIRMACPTPEGRIHTHELWAPKGRLIYFVDIKGTGGVSAVDPRTGKVNKLFEGTQPRCLHVSVCGRERRIVYDTQSSHETNPLDEYQNHLEDIVLFDTATKKHTVLARQLEGLHHPRHMHPVINRRGDMVCFTVADKANSKVAVVKIE